MLDPLLESLEALRRHSARTLLTGLSVAWGVFTLVVLLAAGKGLENGALWQFRNQAVNSLWASGGQTSLPFEGRPPGRAVRLSMSDVEALTREVPEVEQAVAAYATTIPLSVAHGKQRGAFDVRGVQPTQRFMDGIELTHGRFINERDLVEQRKVAVVSAQAGALLFEGNAPLGEYVDIGGHGYQIIGQFKEPASERVAPKMLVPITTLQVLYGAPGDVRDVALTLRGTSAEQSLRVVERIRDLLGARHGFASDDLGALRVHGNLEAFTRLNGVFRWLGLLVWGVGILTLIAGAIGVSNIMFIAVAERTPEIGIRRALGATPGSIVRAVTLEAILLTTMTGYVGLVAGALLTNWVAARWGDSPFLREPRVDLSVIAGATLVLVLSGAVGGYIPARSASRMSVVEALRGSS